MVPRAKEETADMLTSAEQKVINAVDALGVPYEVIPIDPAYADTAAFCHHYGYPLECSANTIIVTSHREPKQLAACVVLATTPLDGKKRVRKLLGVFSASVDTSRQMM